MNQGFGHKEPNSILVLHLANVALSCNQSLEYIIDTSEATMLNQMEEVFVDLETINSGDPEGFELIKWTQTHFPSRKWFIDSVLHVIRYTHIQDSSMQKLS